MLDAKMREHLTSEIALARVSMAEHLTAALTEAVKDEAEVGVIEGAILDALAAMNRRIALEDILHIDAPTEPS